MRAVPILCCAVAACGGGGAQSDAGKSDAAGVIDVLPPTDVPADADTTVPGFSTWPRDKILYHAYVRSFFDSDGDGHGDLPGLTQKLDYIQALGVDGILLLPIFADTYIESGGYGTTDYGHVTAAYGGDAAFAAFVTAAHAKGLKVILDLSFTLVADQHPWFAAAMTSAAAPERAHFEVTSGPPCPTLTDQVGGNGWHAFADSQCFFSDYAAQFPSLNQRDEATAEAMRVAAEHWLAAGVDGFRLDSASSIAQVDPANPTAAKDPSSPATHAFWLPFMQRIKRANPDVFAVAELFDHEADYYADGIDMTFQYQIYFGLVDGWTKSIKSTLSFTLAAQLAARPTGSFGGIFTGNHDVPGGFVAPGGRLADVACPLPCTDHTPLVTAAMLLFSLPGTPFVYYGEELGMRGAADVDTSQTLPWSRNPMQWDATSARGFTTGTPWTPVSTDSANVAAQVNVAGSMLETYKGLIGTRKGSPALEHGGYREVPTDRPDVFAFVREDPAERVLVVASFGHAATATNLDLASLGITSAIATERIFGSALPAVTAANAGAYGIALPAQGAIWILLK